MSKKQLLTVVLKALGLFTGNRHPRAPSGRSRKTCLKECYHPLLLSYIFLEAHSKFQNFKKARCCTNTVKKGNFIALLRYSYMASVHIRLIMLCFPSGRQMDESAYKYTVHQKIIAKSAYIRKTTYKHTMPQL